MRQPRGGRGTYSRPRKAMWMMMKSTRRTQGLNMAEQSEVGFGPLAEDPAAFLARFLKLTNEIMAPFSTHLEKRHKINVNEFRVLMSVGRLGTAASHELVEFTGVHPMAVSRGVNKLIRDG